MMTTRNIIAFAAMAAAAMLSIGCSVDPNSGYTLASQYRSGIKSVAVPVWTKGQEVYRRDLEMRLSEAIIKRIELDTPYKVTSKGRADTLLSGSIDNIRQRVLSMNPDTGLSREVEITFFVSFTWSDLRSGDTIVKKSNLRVSGTYIPPEPVAEDFFQGSEDVINRLAKRIVEQMEAEW